MFVIEFRYNDLSTCIYYWGGRSYKTTGEKYAVICDEIKDAKHFKTRAAAQKAYDKFVVGRFPCHNEPDTYTIIEVDENDKEI
ncbi:MAG: hypothetical protein IJK26_09650 [Clostridia bacterium]|nr:hypothetical protein [Clostridia bacterium]